jgi:hypothetical protein
MIDKIKTNFVGISYEELCHSLLNENPGKRVSQTIKTNYTLKEHAARKLPENCSKGARYTMSRKAQPSLLWSALVICLFLRKSI